MAGRLLGKVAIVTGAAPRGEGVGNGMATAIMFAREGAKVVLVNRSAERAEKLAKQIKGEGGEAAVFAGDVAKGEVAEAMAEFAVKTYGRLDILHNNVGVSLSGGDAELDKITEEAFDRCVAINLKSCILAAKHVIPIMRQQKSGAIINISSINGQKGQMGQTNYSAAKAGEIGFTKALAQEGARAGITVNAIAPGWHGGTQLGRERRASATPGDIARFENYLNEAIPMGRRATPEDLAGLAIYLASSASRYVTGQVFAHDGGMTAT